MLDPCLRRLGLFDLFDNVWSCDDFNTTKANPEIYRMAAEKIGERVEDIIFVDDNPGAVRTAGLSGMRAFGILDESGRDYIDEMKTVSDRYIYTLSELL
jgi:FMN phosphatase YigB (HAD superfamily)